jgi:hypothetical protein
MASKSSIWQSPVVLIILFLLIVGVRFNRNSWLVKRDLHDAAFYISNVKFFRGDTTPPYALWAPFNERLLVTLAAAPLPFDAMTSINIVNVLFLLIAIYFLYKTLLLYDLNKKLIWTGLYLFAISFPTFYYSTIGYIDSGVLLMIFMGNYAILTNRPPLFLLAVVLGTLAKEGIVLLVPVAVAYAYSTKNRRWYAYALLALVLYLVVWGAVKRHMPNTHGTTPLLFWKPIGWRIADNLTRPNFYLSSLFSFGIPWSLMLVFLVWRRNELKHFYRSDLPLLTGAFFGFMLWVYSIFSAHADGRFFWIAYCYPILLGMIWLKRYKHPFSSSTST